MERDPSLGGKAWHNSLFDGYTSSSKANGSWNREGWEWASSFFWLEAPQRQCANHLPRWW